VISIVMRMAVHGGSILSNDVQYLVAGGGRGKKERTEPDRLLSGRRSYNSLDKKDIRFFPHV